MRKFLISLLLVLKFISLPNCLVAQVRVDFKPRASVFSPNRTIYNIKGDFVFAGNTNMTRLDYADDLMNDGMMIYVDVDNDEKTVNSSSANVVFSNENNSDIACTNVLFAGLYWTGRGPQNMTFNVFKNGNSYPMDKRKVKFKGPGQQEYVDIEASDNSIRYPPNLNDDLGMFVGYAEVTEFVREWGVGEYHVGNIALIEGTNWHYGGWGMVVVYENPNMESRDITVFDGYAFVRGRGTESYEIPVSGFSAGNSGDINLKLGIMAGEGDVGAAGDFLAIQKLNNPHDRFFLSHELNDTENFFNSSILTGGNNRNPNLRNNTGMDIAVFDVPNENKEIIGNNQTETTFFYGSTYDVYAIFNITMAIDANDVGIEPFNQAKSINGVEVSDAPYQLVPGDILGLELTLKNRGETEIIDGLVEIPIPRGMELHYVEVHNNTNSEGSRNYFIDETKGVNGVLVWEVGTLPVTENPEFILALLTYEFKISEDCEELVKVCPEDTQLSGLFKGTNGLTNTEINSLPFITSFSEVNDCINQPILDPLLIQIETDEFLESNCNWKSGEEIVVCPNEKNSVDYQLVAQKFPDWVNFFAMNPENQFMKIEVGEEFQLNAETTTYYAGYENPNSCLISFSLTQNYLILEEDFIRVESCGEQSLYTLGIKASGGTEPYLFKWDDLNRTENPILSGVRSGTYAATVTDALGCSVNIEIKIPEDELVLSVVEESSHLDLGCLEGSGVIGLTIEASVFPVNLLITGEKSGQTVYEEHLIIESQEELSISDLPSGSYQLTLIDQGGCTVEQEIDISVIEDSELEVSFNTDSESTQNGGYFFQNSKIKFFSESSSSELDYFWEFGDGNTSTDVHPTHIYENSGEFTVALTARDEFGCEANYTLTLSIHSFFFRMPNAFTPNRSEGNSHFFPVFSSLSKIEFLVFNRWGELLFYTEDLNSEGWDGRHNGMEMPNGMYVYQVYYKSLDNEEGKKTGSFLLFR